MVVETRDIGKYDNATILHSRDLKRVRLGCCHHLSATCRVTVCVIFSMIRLTQVITIFTWNKEKIKVFVQQRRP